MSKDLSIKNLWHPLTTESIKIPAKYEEVKGEPGLYKITTEPYYLDIDQNIIITMQGDKYEELLDELANALDEEDIEAMNDLFSQWNNEDDGCCDCNKDCDGRDSSGKCDSESCDSKGCAGNKKCEEEKCGQCGKMKDKGEKCWWCSYNG